MNYYKVLNKQKYKKESFSIVPIRYQDRMDIMNWRNEQIYHLRQNKPLSEEDQENYFNNVIPELFDKKEPNQILFSYLKNDKCIGYGGLVHINWIDKNAEISFIMNTALEKEYFEYHWSMFLGMIEEVAFSELKFHKLYIHAFDLRPRLYIALKLNYFFEDARLKEHCCVNKDFIDVVIHSKLNMQ